LIEGGGELGLRSYLLASSSGTSLHVLLDATMYSDVKPLWPSPLNPIYDPGSLAGPVYAFCGISLLAGLIMYVLLVGRKTD